MTLRAFPEIVVSSGACRACGGRGWLFDWDVDLSKRNVPCPHCRPNPMQAQMSAEFGTDAQRRRPGAKP